MESKENIKVSDFDVVWICPVCGTKNLDNYLETVFPACESVTEKGHIFNSFDWGDLLTQQDFARLNALMDQIDQEGE